MTLEREVQPRRDKLTELQLKEQAARLSAEQFAQQLAEAKADEAALEARLTPQMKGNALQAEITRLADEIAALGAVNLAALEELTTSRERKTFLDAQSTDLTAAITTLEDAIRKIDRETREMLQQTFDQVNTQFGQLFPTLFGGGEARLIMTGEEILDAGVQVMAQPPGKRNSTIHLLSGGEKALTATALVFALFKLNPGAVLPARRGRRAARRRQHRSLLPAGAVDDGQHAVPLHHAQQDRDGDGAAADRRHDAGAGRVAHRGGRHRQRGPADGRGRLGRPGRDEQPPPRAAGGRRRAAGGAVRLQQVAGATGAEAPGREHARRRRRRAARRAAPARRATSRIEPRLDVGEGEESREPRAPRRVAEPGDLVAPPGAPHVDGWMEDPLLDFVLELRCNHAFDGVAALEARAQLDRLALPLPTHLAVWDPKAQHWTAPDRFGFYSELLASVQMATRRQVLGEIEASRFVSAVQQIALAIDADFDAPEMGRLVAQAAELDALCARFDVQITLTLEAQDGPMDSAVVSAAAADAGFVAALAGSMAEARRPGAPAVDADDDVAAGRPGRADARRPARAGRPRVAGCALHRRAPARRAAERPHRRRQRTSGRRERARHDRRRTREAVRRDARGRHRAGRTARAAPLRRRLTMAGATPSSRSPADEARRCAPRSSRPTTPTTCSTRR